MEAVMGEGDKGLVARRVRRSEMAGTGCFVQFLGLLVGGVIAVLGGPVGWVVGAVVLLVFLIVGGQMSVKWSCGHCKNPLANGTVKMCPVCKARLE